MKIIIYIDSTELIHDYNEITPITTYLESEGIQIPDKLLFDDLFKKGQRNFVILQNDEEVFIKVEITSCEEYQSRRFLDYNNYQKEKLVERKARDLDRILSIKDNNYKKIISEIRYKYL